MFAPIQQETDFVKFRDISNVPVHPVSVLLSAQGRYANEERAEYVNHE